MRHFCMEGGGRDSQRDGFDFRLFFEVENEEYSPIVGFW